MRAGRYRCARLYRYPYAPRANVSTAPRASHVRARARDSGAGTVEPGRILPDRYRKTENVSVAQGGPVPPDAVRSSSQHRACPERFEKSKRAEPQNEASEKPPMVVRAHARDIGVRACAGAQGRSAVWADLSRSAQATIAPNGFAVRVWSQGRDQSNRIHL